MFKKNSITTFYKNVYNSNRIILKYSRNFTDFLKGTKSYREQHKEQSNDQKSKSNSETNTKPSDSSSSNQVDKKENIEIMDKKISENKEIPQNIIDEMDEELNTIHKESHNLDQRRQFKGSEIGRKDNQNKEFPHGYDKI
jgi:hypothetical protein